VTQRCGAHGYAQAYLGIESIAKLQVCLEHIHVAEVLPVMHMILRLASWTAAAAIATGMYFYDQSKKKELFSPSDAAAWNKTVLEKNQNKK
jgi:hypothetical protein